MSSAPAKSRPSRRDRAARRDAFMLKAAEAFREIGIRDATMDGVAAHIGVAKVILYRHFASRDDLVEQILEAAAVPMVTALRDEWTGFGSGMRRLLAIARTNPSGFLLVARHSRDDPRFGSAYDELQRAIVERIKAIYADGRPKPRSPSGVLLSALSERAVAVLAIDALAGWIESGSSEDDALFLRWYASGTQALDGAWRAGLLSELAEAESGAGTFAAGQASSSAAE